MYLLAKEPLIRVSITDKTASIGLVNYADMVVFDKEQTIIALRIGGYPEAVQGMSDAICGGCNLDLQGATQTLHLNTKGRHQYRRNISHNGLYAEAIHYLKDDDAHSLELGNEDGEQQVDLERNMYVFCHNNDELFDELDRKLSVPLLPEFKEYFLSELQQRGILQKLRVCCIGASFDAWHIHVTSKETEVISVLEDGLKSGEIYIPGGSHQDTAVFQNIDSFTAYLHQFGKIIAGKIRTCFPPQFDPADEPVCAELHEVNNHIRQHTGYSLYDAQLGAAEGLKRQLDHNKLALLVAECGTGKTKIGSAALYAYQHSCNRPVTNRKFFNVVVCPSHITGKWVEELHETLPNCLAMHVTSMADIDLLHRIYQQEDKSIFCILSKETARNGYMRRPAVIWNPIKKGFMCPHCGAIQEMTISDDTGRYTVNADAAFFLNESTRNHRCRQCTQPLWCMLNPYDLAPQHNQWIRIGTYGFIHRKFLNSAYSLCRSKANKAKIAAIIENPDGVHPTKGAYARYPLSSYIKRQVRSVDALIVDELHQYSCESAQGQAMAELAGISHKVIGMTATLLNGYAKGIFYLLFRLKPHLMLLDNQSYHGPREFCMQYGVVEQFFEVDAKEYNTTTKASRHKVREKFLPGISPIVYSRFLLENAVFLSLADMGKELPNYEEIPIACHLSDEVAEVCKTLENEFKSIIRQQPKIGNRILSSYMNLLSAYPDQPYGHEPVYNPFVRDKQEALIVPPDIGDSKTVRPKDEAVLKLVEEKIAIGERVIIYTAWTRLDTREKLCQMLTAKGVSTKILNATVPTVQRKEWVNKRLAEGMQVMITNPALVETGLDLNEFTTLIFYNIAYNLYIFRQATRRSYRINQTAPKIEVYMLYYANTMQQRALRLMASKLSAATVIEGNISDEGLAAMSECEDMTTQLAKELIRGIKDDTVTLSDSFKKMAITGHRRASEQLPSHTTVASTSSRLRVIETADIHQSTGQLSVFDLLAS